MLHHKPAFAAALRPPAAIHPLIWQGAAFAFGVLGGGARMPGGTAPLGLALVMGCSRGYILSCGAGGVVSLMKSKLMVPPVSVIFFKAK